MFIFICPLRETIIFAFCVLFPPVKFPFIVASGIAVRSRKPPLSTDILFKFDVSEGAKVPLFVTCMFPIPLTGIFVVVLQPSIVSVVLSLPIIEDAAKSCFVVPVSNIDALEEASVDIVPRS